MIDFSPLVLIRRRINLVTEQLPHQIRFAAIDVHPGRYGGMETTVTHIEGTTYDVVLGLSIMSEETFETQQRQLDEMKAAAFEAIDDEEAT